MNPGNNGDVSETRSGRLTRRSVFGLGTALVAGIGSTACSSSTSSSGSSTTTSPAGDPKAVATDAYIFGYPLVLMDATRVAGAPANTLDHGVLPNPNDKDVVRLNLDTLYTQAWIDLSAGPMVLQVPAMEQDRYWLMQLLDAWTNTQHDPSSLEPQVKSGVTAPPYTYVLTGPGWSGPLPDDATPLPMPTNTAWLIGRIQINGEHDAAAVAALQQQLKLVPLHDWTAGNRAGTHSRRHTAVTGAVPPSKQVADMDGPTFFARMCTVMAANPPAAADAAAMARFASIGITPGGKPNASDEVLNDAAADAKQRIPVYKNPQTKDENGWLFATNVGTYGTDYQQRAYIALTGLGANLPRDALYPTVFGTADTNGTPQRFRIHFPAGQLPPVNAFWSITAYDADSFFVPNPDNIYAVGHEIPIITGPDGSVDIAVQNAKPGPDVPAGHWLPIPAAGKFSLTLRLYAPKSQAVDGTWQPPALTPII